MELLLLLLNLLLLVLDLQLLLLIFLLFTTVSALLVSDFHVCVQVPGFCCQPLSVYKAQILELNSYIAIRSTFLALWAD